MAKKKKKPTEMDLWEKSIRDNAKYFMTIAFQPRVGSVPLQPFNNLQQAIEYATIVMNEKGTHRYRTVFVYAIDKDDHHAMCGSVNCFKKEWEPIE